MKKPSEKGRKRVFGLLGKKRRGVKAIFETSLGACFQEEEEQGCKWVRCRAEVKENDPLVRVGGGP